ERARFQPHVEEYEHLGGVQAGYRELGPLWEAALASERRRVEPEEAMLRSVVQIEAPIEAAWKVVTDAGTWKEFMRASQVAVLPGARGTLADGEIHCHHGKDGREVTEFRVLLAAPPRELSIFSADQVDFYQTMALAEIGPGRTQVETRVLWRARPGLPGRLMSAVFGFMMSRALARGARTLERLGREAATPPAPRT
ncbi:MAG TPA: SRPBCC family protein, partial [Candidatus Acidoferrales bacterium]|nr:SRPBCC family protein [Candidatus Acidoferrales bacterium]